MDNIENKNNVINTNHVCEHGKCSCCDGCEKCSKTWKHYMGRRFLVLLVAILLAFFVGMKIGYLKGYFITAVENPGKLKLEMPLKK